MTLLYAKLNGRCEIDAIWNFTGPFVWLVSCMYVGTVKLVESIINIIVCAIDGDMSIFYKTVGFILSKLYFCVGFAPTFPSTSILYLVESTMLCESSLSDKSFLKIKI